MFEMGKRHFEPEAMEIMKSGIGNMLVSDGVF